MPDPNLIPANDIPGKLRVPAQIVLDAKTKVASKEVLMDLGEQDNLAYTYYRGLVVKTDDLLENWEWREPKDGTEMGLLLDGYLYPDGLVVDGIDYSNKLYNFFPYLPPAATYTNPLPTPNTVGGIEAGSTFDKKTMQEMWDALLYAEEFPDLVNPSNTFTFNSSGVFETGSTIALINFNATFNRGSINPAYGTNGFRSGLPTQYNYTGPGLVNTPSSSLVNAKSVANYLVANGVNTWAGSVSYSAGQQPLSSEGHPYSTPLPAGTTGSIGLSLTGAYPIFYGKSSSPLTANQSLIDGGTKNVGLSTGTINITFNASTEYIWFAIPQTSTDKTKWYVNALNNGNIGSPSDLFGNDVIIPINSPSGLWTGINYRIYLSNYATTTAGSMQLQN